MLKKIQKNKGFSLVEFIVVITIFSIMSGITIFNYNNHRGSIEQINVAQDIALTIRQAQIYGISAGEGIIGNENADQSELDRSLSNIVSDRAVRGVSFNLDEKTLTLFEDYIGNDGRKYIYYDDGSDRVIDIRTILSSDIEFGDICFNGFVNNGDFSSCHVVEQAEGIVDISFERPYFDAYINYRTNIINSPIPYNSVTLSIIGESNDIFIEVNPIGKITVK